MHESLHMILRLQLYTVGLYYRYNLTNLISARIVLIRTGQPNSMYISRERKQCTKSFCSKISVQTPKLAQICVYTIKTNLAETLVFRKMQSSFADRLRRYICYLPAAKSGREKLCPRSRRARDVFKTEVTVFLIRTDAAGVYFLFLIH